MPLRDFQQAAHEKAVAVLRSGGKRGYSAPTGSGKSYVMAANHDVLKPEGLITIVPSTEIGLGIWERLHGVDADYIRTWSEAKQQSTMEGSGIWTIMRLYNALMSGSIDPPKMLQFDEGHHSTANTYEAVHAVCADCPAVMYTATGFRGTPDETAKLVAKWGQIEPILTLKAAVAQGFVARPDFRVWPLLNDETIKVTNGEFETKATEAALDAVIPDLCKRIDDEFCTASHLLYHGPIRVPVRPLMITAPGVASARAITHALRQRGVSAICITGGSCDGGVHDYVDDETRQEAFAKVTRCESVLVQVNVVSEGVDLPIRIHIDTAPCMSPVRWQQRVGRGTRPIPEGEERPIYICTNHNLTRHAYLWAGLIPAAQVRDAQQAWGPDFKPSRRMFARALGIEGFGRFTVSQVPLVDGTFAALYALQTPDGTSQYAVILHPTREKPLFFERKNPHTGEIAEKTLDDGHTVQYKVKDYGPWRLIGNIPNMDGYVSTKPGKITPPMLAWWRGDKGRGAEWHGLDPAFVPNVREFQMLPILSNTRLQFKQEK